MPFLTPNPLPVAIERWTQALRVLEAMDEHARANHFDMSDWLNKNACGTVGCVAGHCGLDPWFQARGFSMFLDETGEGRFGTADGRLDFADCDPERFFADELNGQQILYTHGDHTETVARIQRHIAELRHVQTIREASWLVP